MLGFKPLRPLADPRCTDLVEPFWGGSVLGGVVVVALGPC
ncbi:hypothetical protein EV14_1505 [Prochlorococcus sp. MIT 0703]|nr:hypothetical protein EV14_1505 [Prochlorococcus sp. MIT 0703]